LAAALGHFWEVHGYLQEANGWLERATTVGDGVPTAIRAKVCGAAGHVAFLRSDYSAAGWLLEESLRLAREEPSSPGTMQALTNLALVSMSANDYTRAAELLQESRDMATDVGDTTNLATSLNLLGQVAFECGRLAEAHAMLEQSLALCRTEGNSWGTARALCDLGQLWHAQGEDATALALHREALAIWRDLADEWGVAYASEGLAVTFGIRRPELAVRLLATATCARQRVGIRRLPAREINVEATRQACASVLSVDAFGTAWALGTQTRLDSTVDELLEQIDA
jgi:tetratricopeptide (TPR) repeat protein